MVRKSTQWVTVAALVATMVATTSSRMRAQDQSGQGIGAAVQRARGSYQADALRQAIATNRSSVVADLLSRWAAPIGTGRGLEGWQTRFTTADAEILLKMATAGTWDEVVAASYGVSVNALGDVTQDLVFNPIAPCRVLDTRFGVGAFHGPYNSPQILGFDVTDSLNAGRNQGGPANCGVPFGVGTAVALNITAVATGADGDVKVWPFGAVEPNASIVNFKGGTNVANAADVAIANANATNDLNIKVEFATQVNYVVDVVGYFAAPHATALDTLIVQNTGTVASGVNLIMNTLPCPTTYALTGGGSSYSISPNPNIWFRESAPDPTLNIWHIDVTNMSGSSVTFTVYAVCSRVPGR